MAVGLCLVAFLLCLVATRRSVVAGLCVAMCFGYFYGILRANLMSLPAHFIFDSATAGLYVGLYSQKLTREQINRSVWARKWLLPLVLWPIAMALVPMQPYMVQLVGLRGNMFFLFYILIGSMLAPSEVRTLAICMGLLNLVSLGFGVQEYRLGIEPFYPLSPVTEIIYNSRDVAGAHFRIPATFANSASYGFTMALTTILLMTAWNNRKESAVVRYLLAACIAGSAAGALLSASRSVFIIFAIVFAGFLWNLRGRASMLGLLVVLGGVGILAAHNDRMQRFESLTDTNADMHRIQMSVNESFLEIMARYPLGHGMGAGGTSMPYFLQAQIRDPVAIENEYGRILLEQGLPGLVLWVAFLLNMVTKPIVEPDPTIRTGKSVVRIYLLFQIATSCIGTGIFAAIPPTPFLLMGWFVGGNPDVRLPLPRRAASPPQV